MSNENLLTAVATVMVALPGTAPLVPNLTLSPEAQFVLLVLSLFGAAILKFQRGAALSEEDVQRIAAERERIRRAEIGKIRAAGARAARDSGGDGRG